MKASIWPAYWRNLRAREHLFFPAAKSLVAIAFFGVVWVLALSVFPIGLPGSGLSGLRIFVSWVTYVLILGISLLPLGLIWTAWYGTGILLTRANVVIVHTPRSWGFGTPDEQKYPKEDRRIEGRGVAFPLNYFLGRVEMDDKHAQGKADLLLWYMTPKDALWMQSLDTRKKDDAAEAEQGASAAAKNEGETYVREASFFLVQAYGSGEQVSTLDYIKSIATGPEHAAAREDLLLALRAAIAQRHLPAAPAVDQIAA